MTMPRSRGTTTTSLFTATPTSCDRLTPRPSATFAAPTSVGFFSPRSSLEIMAQLTPDRCASVSSVQPRSRSGRWDFGDGALRALRGPFALQRALGGRGDREGIEFPREAGARESCISGRGSGRGCTLLRVGYGVRSSGGDQRPHTAGGGVLAAAGGGTLQLGPVRGALGVGTVIGADLSGMSFRALSDWSALKLIPLFPI